jgi:antitoxin VapB
MSKRVVKTTKTFKSGNSIAVRLPASLGVKEGIEMRVREEQGRYVVEPIDLEPRKTLDISGFWGKAHGLAAPPRDDFNGRPSAATKTKPRR